MPHSLFISDLHLSPETPAATASLVRFLSQTATHADSLYVLGDLFEYWIGDEGMAQPHAQQVIQALRTLKEKAGAPYSIHGIRNFLSGEPVAKPCALPLFEDPTG